MSEDVASGIYVNYELEYQTKKPLDCCRLSALRRDECAPLELRPSWAGVYCVYCRIGPVSVLSLLKYVKSIPK